MIDISVLWLLPSYRYALFSFVKIGLKPFVSSPSNSIVIKLFNNNVVIDSIKGFLEVYKDSNSNSKSGNIPERKDLLKMFASGVAIEFLLIE